MRMSTWVCPRRTAFQHARLDNSPRKAELRKLAWSGVPNELRPLAWQLLLVCLTVLLLTFKPSIGYLVGLPPAANTTSLVDARTKARRVLVISGLDLCARPRGPRPTNMAPNRDRRSKNTARRAAMDVPCDTTSKRLQFQCLSYR